MGSNVVCLCCKPNGCGICNLQKLKHFENSTNHGHFKNQRKAGVVLFNNNTNKILIVQSRGNLWGLPKGSCNNNETIIECASRELFEETGITITADEISESKFKYKKSHFRIGTCIYYYIERNIEESINLQKVINEKNDVSGIGWININCIKDMTPQLKLNLHIRKALGFFFNLKT